MEHCETVGFRTITLNKSRGQHRTKIVKILEISDMDEIKSILLSLLSSCRQLSVSNQDFPAQSDVQQFSEFSEVDIPQV